MPAVILLVSVVSLTAFQTQKGPVGLRVERKQSTSHCGSLRSQLHTHTRPNFGLPDIRSGFFVRLSSSFWIPEGGEEASAEGAVPPNCKMQNCTDVLSTRDVLQSIGAVKQKSNWRK